MDRDRANQSGAEDPRVVDLEGEYSVVGVLDIVAAAARPIRSANRGPQTRPQGPHRRAGGPYPGVPLAAEVDLEIIARGTPGMTGADLENLVNEAALFAARQSKERVW